MPFAARTGARQLFRIAACLVVAAALPAGADVTVTQLANEGVIIDDGAATRIMIDGMIVEPYSVYGGLPEELHAVFNEATGPFGGIDLALASHQHHDHNQPVHACTFMQSAAETIFASSTQVMDLMREKCRQFTLSSSRLRIIDPQYDQPATVQAGDATVQVFLLSHGRGRDERLQNFGHLVEIGGMRVLHIGDAAMEAADFARAGVDKMDVDIALIPFWYFQPGPGAGIVRRFLDAPHKVAVHVPPGELEEVKQLLRTEYPRVILLENVLDQAQFSVTAPPPP